MWLANEQSADEPQEPDFETSAGLPTQRLPPLPADTLRLPAARGQVAPGESEPLRVAYKLFKSTWKSWDDMFREAAAFATHNGRERLISISHSADQGAGVVTVWYWMDWNDDPRQT